MKQFLLFPLLLLSIVASAQFTIVVNAIPGNTPANDPIHIAGDFQSWDPGSSAHILSYDQAEDYYHISIPSGIGTIAFKFTRGDWTKVESDANGDFIADRTSGTTAGDTLWLQIEGWEDLNGGGGGQSTAANNVSMLSEDFYMTALDRTRKVWIYLPPDYASSTEDYPVLYLHDGQNVFDAFTSFAGEWEVDETLNDLHAQGDPGIIAVAIANGEALRIDEYCPWVNPQYGGGEGADYIDFIVNDLKPHIDANYRTKSGREHTGLMGSSLGGLISTYGGLEHPDVFSKIGAFSPAYWINPEMTGYATSIGRQDAMRIYQLGGSLEGGTLIADMWAMDATLAAEGFGSEELLTVEKADGEHSEWFWAREFEAAYVWLFAEAADTMSSVRSTPNAASVQVYPNPARASVRIDIEESLTGAGAQAQVMVYNALGKVVLQQALAQSTTLKLHGLAPGLYTYRLHGMATGTPLVGKLLVH